MTFFTYPSLYWWPGTITRSVHCTAPPGEDRVKSLAKGLNNGCTTKPGFGPHHLTFESSTVYQLWSTFLNVMYTKCTQLWATNQNINPDSYLVTLFAPGLPVRCTALWPHLPTSWGMWRKNSVVLHICIRVMTYEGFLFLIDAVTPGQLIGMRIITYAIGYHAGQHPISKSPIVLLWCSDLLSLYT